MGRRRPDGMTDREMKCKSEMRYMIRGFREAFGMSWFDAHPGKDPTTIVEAVSEDDLVCWYNHNGLKRPHPSCSPARWRMFVAKINNPERYEMSEY